METPMLIGAAVLGVLLLLLAINLTPRMGSRKLDAGYSHTHEDFDSGDGD
ncbi:MAG TPA: hypothetical protein VIO94_08205 [Phenylobacterium sp.]